MNEILRILNFIFLQSKAESEVLGKQLLSGSQVFISSLVNRWEAGWLLMFITNYLYTVAWVAKWVKGVRLQSRKSWAKVQAELVTNQGLTITGDIKLAVLNIKLLHGFLFFTYSHKNLEGMLKNPYPVELLLL